MTIKFEYDEAAIARKREAIADMRRRAQDVSPAWDALLDWFVEQNFDQFKSKGGRYREAWKPLKPETVAQKTREGYPRDPLIRTGRLVHSLTLRPMGVEHITGRDVSAGTNVPYAKHHHYGAPRAGVPQRILFSTDQIRKEQAATSAVANWIIKGERKVGGRTVLRGGT